MADYEHTTFPADDLEAPVAYTAGRGGFGIVWGIGESEAPDPPDEVVPRVENVSPAPGSLAADGTIAFDVVDPSGAMLVAVLFADFPIAKRDEVIHNGTTFGRLYSGTRSEIAGGWHFEFSRVGGWPRTNAGAPERLRLTVVAFDAAGNAVIV